MKMTFEFDDEKLKELNMTLDQALFPIREFYKKKNVLDNVTPGVFEPVDKTADLFGFFGCATRFPKELPYFLKTISKWEWDLDEEGVEDCLYEYLDYEREHGRL